MADWAEGNYTLRTIKKLSLPWSKYFHWASRESCLMRDELFQWWLVEHGIKSIVDVYNNRVYDYYLEEASAMKTFGKISEDIIREWPRHIGNYKAKRKALVSAADEVRRAALKRDAKAAWRAFTKFSRARDLFGEYLFGAWSVIFFMEPEVLKRCGEDADRIVALDQPVQYLLMRRDLFRLSNKALEKKYGWLNVYNPEDKPFLAGDFVRLRHEVNKEEVRKEFVQFAKNRKAFNAVLAKMKDKRLRRMAEIVHAYTFLKTDRVDAWKHSVALFHDFFAFLAEFIPGATILDASNMALQEIRNLLCHGQIPNREELKLRSRGILYHLRPGKLDILYDAEQLSQAKKGLEARYKTNKLIGVCVCKGKARGPVKIIAHSDDLKKIEKGDIFVAKYTFPTFTPAMIKSAAIVTDDGGITSHAAIVSREFKIPCIVGTKIATKVLKDGDMVEVDAEKGIVRKLS